jgi:hypothetical protein
LIVGLIVACLVLAGVAAFHTPRHTGHPQPSSALHSAGQQYDLAAAAFDREMCSAISGPTYSFPDNASAAETRFQSALSNINWPEQVQADAGGLMNTLTEGISTLRSVDVSETPAVIARLNQAENVLRHDLGFQNTGATLGQTCGGG